ncbi:MAG: hypothetical protein ACO1N7_01065 [Sphingobacteriaceae bacterium]
MIKTFCYFISLLLILGACTSGRKAMNQGNYDEAIYKAVKRLRSNNDHKKSLTILTQTYPLAQKWHLNRIKDLEASYDRFKWEPVAREYAALINLYEEILRCPGCLTAVPSPQSYAAEYESAKLKAASERYNAGIESLDKGKLGDRNEAKNAFYHFAEANNWINNYKDTDQKLKDAEYYATVSVVVEPIPMHSRALKLSNEFFDNKINEFMLRAPVNRFVKFYTAREAKKLGINKPHHIIQLVFDDFVVGQTYMHEKETALIKDSIVLATYEVDVPATSNSQTTNGKITICHTAPGSNRSETLNVAESALKAHLDHGDKLGSCNGDKASPTSNSSTAGKKETRKVYGQAKATMHVFTRTVESKGLLDLRILDGYTKRVINQEKLPGSFVWQSQWGYFNGDERALEKQHKQITKNKDIPPPPPQDLFIEFTKPIYQQVTAAIANFYKNY